MHHLAPWRSWPCCGAVQAQAPLSRPNPASQHCLAPGRQPGDRSRRQRRPVRRVPLRRQPAVRGMGAAARRMPGRRTAPDRLRDAGRALLRAARWPLPGAVGQQPAAPSRAAAASPTARPARPAPSSTACARRRRRRHGACAVPLRRRQDRGRGVQQRRAAAACRWRCPTAAAWSLPQARSASGARYANADQSFVFWNKGETAFIEENGQPSYSGCRTRP